MSADAHATDDQDDDELLAASAELAASLGSPDVEPGEWLDAPTALVDRRAEVEKRIRLLRSLAQNREGLPGWADELPIFRAASVRSLAIRVYNLLARELRHQAGLSADALDLMKAELWGDDLDEVDDTDEDDGEASER